MSRQLIKTRYRVVLPDHAELVESAICELLWPQVPGYSRLSQLIPALVEGRLEHVAVLSDFDGGDSFVRSDMFVNEDFRQHGLRRNELATTIYRRATLSGRSGSPVPEDPEELPEIGGPTVLFDRQVWF
ncbi:MULTISPECIES: hypothetical protein [unclassified Bradyrhizobium]|uniref:hypothetical protein n=1 Tax=unclassified Bradyrhizobium TaxID=2631580 RepID=UPI00291710EF|nr:MULTISPECIES: hypothetical protein [unclassified Bradyrhizobium]